MEINGNELKRMKLNQDEPTVKNISENESTNQNQQKSWNLQELNEIKQAIKKSKNE